MFYQIKLRTSVIPLFHVIFTGKFISGVILMIQCHLEGQEVNFKVKLMKMSFLTNTTRNKCNKSFWCDFDYTESIYDIIMAIQGHLQGPKVNSKVKAAKKIFLTNTNSSQCNTTFSCVFG